MKYSVLFFIGAILFSARMDGQNFSYTLSKDSVLYASFVSPDVLVSASTIPAAGIGYHLPFSMNICGESTDTLYIYQNGFVDVVPKKMYAVAVFNNFGIHADSLGHITGTISTEISGGTGNRILKLEFKDLSQNRYSYFDHLSYQLWFYENGSKIELHIGQNSGLGDQELFGLVARTDYALNRAYLASGDPSAPSGSLINGETEYVYLNQLPSQGTVYTLTPNY